MRNRPIITEKHMKEDIHEGGHRVVLRTADAYAYQLNTEKKHSMSGYDTVIYGNNI
jgi:hypothetical protein